MMKVQAYQYTHHRDGAGYWLDQVLLSHSNPNCVQEALAASQAMGVEQRADAPFRSLMTVQERIPCYRAAPTT